MRKTTLFSLLLLLCLTLTPVSGYEGMWLPSLIGEGRIGDMRAKGLKLQAEELYSVNQASLKDAIVRFGSGCTGELISDQGLLLTNHHCGYSQIQQHSSVANDYLTYGFAAMNRAEELPNPGLVVTFLVEMRDVTAEMLEGVKTDMTEAQQNERIKANSDKIAKAATKGNHYKASVESMYYGNTYYLFIYEVFEDVRLVFAPPSAIGKFGGDTDNWMWPRHTGDFSVFRVYAGPDNKPAPYSEENVPYKPKKSFTLSLKGPQPDDFTFIYGFPGRTYEYLHSAEVDYIQNVGDPHKIMLRTLRLEEITQAQEADPEVRIKYAAKHARISNAWKKWQGEVKGLERLGTIERKRIMEEEFEKWAAASNNPAYSGLTRRMQALYDTLRPYQFAKDYYTEAAYGIELLAFAKKIAELTPEKLADMDQRAKLVKEVEDFYKDYEPEVDRSVAMKIFPHLREALRFEWLPNSLTGNAPHEVYVHRMFDPKAERSILLNRTRMVGLLDMEWDSDRLFETLNADPNVKLARELIGFEKERITPEFNRLNAELQKSYKLYMRAIMEMEQQREFYPDANSTLRIAYGKVEGYKPADGIRYAPFTTLEGVMQKDNPEIYDYDVPEKLRAIYAAKDYGPWEVNGTVPVAFIASNHTTGGNSGSPLLNAEGHMIGINFDRCWEGTMSDIDFDPDMCRNISVDIRYVLFVIDKVGGAGYLLDEMTFDRERGRKSG